MQKELILAFLIGMLIGAIACKLVTKMSTVGVIRIDDSDPDRDRFNMQITVPMSSLKRRNYVSFAVEKQT